MTQTHTHKHLAKRLKFEIIERKKIADGKIINNENQTDQIHS